MIVTIKKIEERSDARIPDNIEEGHIYQANIEEAHFREPVVGEVFYVGGFRTSTVQEILTPATFKTYNSVYEWTTDKKVIVT